MNEYDTMDSERLASHAVHLQIADATLHGHLVRPADAHGAVLFVRSAADADDLDDRAMTDVLTESGFVVLTVGLLSAEEAEEDRLTARFRYDLPLLSQRIAGVAEWAHDHEATRGLDIGVFGEGAGSAAALVVAAVHPRLLHAVALYNGRPDLAGEALAAVEAPTLLVVGTHDVRAQEASEEAQGKMERAEVRLEQVEGESGFADDGALDEALRLAANWFRTHLGPGETDSGAEAEGASPGRRADVHRSSAEVAAMIRAVAEPLDGVDTADLGPLLDRIGDAEVVLLGEATHGTSEFYRMRQRITQRLIEEKGFTVVAVEADWPDAERVDEYVHGRVGRGEHPWEAFVRFPTWMWRNHDVLEFVEWLRAHNEECDPGAQVGFYGLDLYSLYTSVHEVLAYLEDRDPDLADTARARYACLAPFEADPALYGRAVVTDQYRGCEDEAVAMLQDLLEQRMAYSAGGDAGQSGRRLFDATQNAAVVRDAERYYRAMFYGSPSSWNLRDTHMFETLRAVRAFRGTGDRPAKAVVWAHNSHVGNAAFTQMGARGELNIGHLCRGEYGDAAYLIGFGTHAGTVAAASDWGEPVEVKRVRPSHAESYGGSATTAGSPASPCPSAMPALRFATS